jgi:hypothetical protein
VSLTDFVGGELSVVGGIHDNAKERIGISGLNQIDALSQTVQECLHVRGRVRERRGNQEITKTLVGKFVHNLNQTRLVTMTISAGTPVLPIPETVVQDGHRTFGKATVDSR